MIPRKLKVGIVTFPYAGNGGTQSQHPDVCDWMIRTIIAAKKDERIEDGIAQRRFADTPITLNRNAALEWAKQRKIDVLVMVDSDQAPDLYMGSAEAKPFFESSFEHLYDHYEKGPLVIVAPYCGPPGHPTQGGHENVYVFKWEDLQTGRERDEFKMEQYSRAEAAQLTGIREVAAGPTGLCMIDMRCLEYMTPPYFYYQYEGDGPICPLCHQEQAGIQAEKASTEDVTFFRDLSLAVCDNLGYNPVLCNWDAWAGHWKPWCVGKPTDLTAANVSGKLKRAYERSPGNKKALIEVGPKGPVGMVPSAKSDVRLTIGGCRSGKTLDGMRRHDEIIAAENDPSNLGHVTLDSDLAVLRELARAHAYVCRNDESFRCVELGSWTGKSAIVIAEAVEIWRGDKYELHCIDTFEATGDATEKMKRAAADGDPIFQTFKKNLGARFDQTVFPHRNTTVGSADHWRMRGAGRKLIDFLFIDAGHEYEDVKADLEAWMPFLRPGAVVCGHDYGTFPGVEKAVKERLGNVAVSGTVWSAQLWPGPGERLTELRDLKYGISGGMHSSAEAKQLSVGTNGEAHP